MTFTKRHFTDLTIISLILLGTLSSSGQGLMLEPGRKFILSQSFNQNTSTEATNVQGNVSLDIHCTVMLEVVSVIDSASYQMDCQYKDLSISLFSADMDIALSSETSSFGLIIKYLDLLKEKKFGVSLSNKGELLSISGLDDFILSLYSANSSGRSGEQDIVIKTLHEAFGESAFRSLINLTLNVYCNNFDDKCEKKVEYAFNAKPVILTNMFYAQPPKEGQIRIQGIGTIEADEEEMDFDSGTVTTMLNGSQTYDHLYDTETGWLLTGNSKQKIYLLSAFHGNEQLPEGLEIPSYTETEYEFSGSEFIEEKKRTRK